MQIVSDAHTCASSDDACQNLSSEDCQNDGQSLSTHRRSSKELHLTADGTDLAHHTSTPRFSDPTPHQYSTIFPPMEPAARQLLEEDIKQHGQREPIIRDQHNRIVDGLNRYRACTAIGVKPKFVTRHFSDEAALTFIISGNLFRRHLSGPQRSAIAAELANLNRGGSQPANLPNAVSQAMASKLMGVSERSTRSAVKVKEISPALHEELKAGNVTVHAAELVCSLPNKDRERSIAAIKAADKKNVKTVVKALKISAGLKKVSAGYRVITGRNGRFSNLLDVLEAIVDLPVQLNALEQYVAQTPLDFSHVDQIRNAVKPLRDLDFEKVVEAARRAITTLGNVTSGDATRPRSVSQNDHKDSDETGERS